MLRHLVHMILSHGKKVAMTRAKAFMKGDWKSLLNKSNLCMYVAIFLMTNVFIKW